MNKYIKAKKALIAYREAEALKDIAYSKDHYNAETRAAFNLAARRHKALHKALREFIHPGLGYWPSVEEFIASN